MTYPNAFSGVKKLHTAQILSLISVICGVVVAILLLLSGSAILGFADLEDGAAFGILALVVGLAAAVLSVIAYIMQIIGLKQAGKDDRSFYTAFVFAIIALILTVAAAIFSVLNVANGFGDDIANIFTKVSAVVIAAFVINGVRNTAEALGQDDMAQKAKSVAILQAVFLCLSIVANIVALFTGNAAEIIATILALISAVLMIIFTIVYLIFLGKAKRMLALY